MEKVILLLEKQFSFLNGFGYNIPIRGSEILADGRPSHSLSYFNATKNITFFVAYSPFANNTQQIVKILLRKVPETYPYGHISFKKYFRKELGLEYRDRTTLADDPIPDLTKLLDHQINFLLTTMRRKF